MNNSASDPRPHIHAKTTVARIMLDWLIALVPAAAVSIFTSGWRVAAIILISVAAAVLGEYLCTLKTKSENTIGDLSAAVTGTIIALSLPASAPLWIPAAASIIAVLVFKELTGGIGRSYLNPAAAVNGLLLLFIPKLISSYGTISIPFAAALVIGFVYAAARQVISIRIPLMYILTFAVLTYLFGAADTAAGELSLAPFLSGGVLLSALFIAPAYSSSPTTPVGRIVFGIGCGIFTFVFRYFGFINAGAVVAILIMNILSPIIERVTVPVPYGKK